MRIVTGVSRQWADAGAGGAYGQRLAGNSGESCGICVPACFALAAAGASPLASGAGHGRRRGLHRGGLRRRRAHPRPGGAAAAVRGAAGVQRGGGRGHPEKRRAGRGPRRVRDLGPSRRGAAAPGVRDAGPGRADGPGPGAGAPDGAAPPRLHRGGRRAGLCSCLACLPRRRARPRTRRRDGDGSARDALDDPGRRLRDAPARGQRRPGPRRGQGIGSRQAAAPRDSRGRGPVREHRRAVAEHAGGVRRRPCRALPAVRAAAGGRGPAQPPARTAGRRDQGRRENRAPQRQDVAPPGSR